MRNVLAWVVMLVLGILLVVLGFEGRLGSFLAAMVSPGSLEPTDASGNAQASSGTGGHCSPEGSVKNVNGTFYICSGGVWTQPKT